MVELLFSKGANANHKDKINQSPLFYAAKMGHVEICKILIKNYANVNQVDLKRQTALFYAKLNKREAVINLLIAKNAINTKDGKLTKSDLNKLKKSHKNKKEKKSSSGKNKKKKTHKTHAAITLQYSLVKTDSSLNQETVNPSEYFEFEKKYPNICRVLKNPEMLQMHPDLMSFFKRDVWRTIALKIISNLWKAKGGNFFHEPVDPVKLNITGYFEVVKKPMDFGTIKKKLQSNIYQDHLEFV